jgi:hypothetical protein
MRRSITSAAAMDAGNHRRHERGGANGTNHGGIGKATAEGRAGPRTNREAGGRSPKVHRALTGLADDDPDLREWPADHDGSAKIALIGIDRSRAAWLQAVEQGVISHAAVQPFIADLIWLGDALERVFPKARAFVRPGLDEPDEIAKLLAVEELGTSADSI